MSKGCPITSVFILGSLVSFFSWVGCVFLFWVTCVIFTSFETTVSSENHFWPVLGFRSAEFTPVFFHSGFGLGLLLLRLRPGFTPFIRYASVWVYFLVCAFFHYGFGLGLLLLRRRPGFDRFQGFGFVSSLPFTSFRVSYFFSFWAFFH